MHSVFFTRFREYDDYLSLLWSQFVIQYDLYAQIRAFENLKDFSNRLASVWAVRWPSFRFSFRLRSLTDRAANEGGAGAISHTPWIAWGILLSLSAMGLLFLSRRSRLTGDQAIRFYTRFLERMARAGRPKRPSETGREYAGRLLNEWPKERREIEAVTERYYRARFAGLI
jgi:hypothetical protein